MRIKGEYWITDDQVWFADGDVGDMDHESFVRDLARRKVVDFFNGDSDGEFMDGDTFKEAMILALREELNDEEIDEDTWEARARKFCEEGNYFNNPSNSFGTEFEVAMDEAEDARELAIIYWGWIWVRQNQLTISHFGREDRYKIIAGIEEILEQEGVEDVKDEDLDFLITIASTNQQINATLADLKEGRNFMIMDRSDFILT